MATTGWAMKGQGYEYCNCDFGCGCNFAGFPNSKDGSCRALVGVRIDSGSCGDVDLAGVTCAAILDWPKAIHEGGGKCAFVVDPSTTDEQAGALGQIFTGQLGGMPWELLGPTFEVVGLEKARITIDGSGPKSTFRLEGIGEGRGDTFKNPVTGDELREFCKGKIAHFKIPRNYKFVDEFPMTVTGKIQKFKMREISIEEMGLKK